VAGPILGTEAVPIVQGGQTRQTTTAALAAANVSAQSFLTVVQEPTLANSQYLSTGTGLGLQNGGAQSYLRVTLNGTSGSLETAGDGFAVKVSGVIVPRNITITGNGLSITDGNGQAGNPAISLSGLPASLAGMSGSGLVAVLSGSTLTPRSILGVSNQTSVTNGNALAGNPTVGLADNAVFPGSGAVTLPIGTQGEQPAGSNGQIRFNSTDGRFEGYGNGSWNAFSQGGITLINTGIGLTGGPITSTGTISIDTTVVATLTGTQTLTNKTISGSNNTLTDIGNGSLTNSSITINGSPISLGGSVSVGSVTDVTATLPILSSGGATPDISIPPANTLDSGYLTSTDWNTFNSKGYGSVTSVSGAGTVNGLTLTGTVTTIGDLTLGGTLSNVANSALTNSSVTINGSAVSLGGSITVTATASNALTIGTGLTGTSYDGSAPVTIAIDSTVATLTGAQTLTNKTLVDPQVTNAIQLTGAGAATYTPFVQTFFSAVTDYNGYQLNYIQNVNNGSDASVDYVAYNDASDVDSYFIDMGIASSNYTSPIYTIFPANGGYLYTGGGTSGQASALLLGTSNSASDITLFTGGTLLANTRATIKGDTGNFLIGTTTDTGYQLNVAGTTLFSGASEFGSTVLLSANPTLALQAATKAYVDEQVTAGIHIHEPVRVETTGNLTATYVQGGTTFNITTITGTNTVTTSVNHGLSVNDQIWLYSTAGNGLLTNTAYFVYSIPALNTLTLSLTFGGSQITGLTNASGLTYATRANSGIGATLTNAGVQIALEVDGVPLSVTDRVMVRLQTNGEENGVYTVTTVGTILTNWVLTRATDANFVSPSDPQGLGTGDYFYTREGLLNAGDSHVLTTEPNTMIIGYTPLTYTQFSGSVDYIGGTNITVSGQTISVSGTIAATLGGTGTSTVTTGDLLYGSGTNTWSKLPLGVGYKSLVVNASGTQVEWNAVALNQASAVSGQLGASNGGTGLSSYAIGDMIYSSGTTTLAKLALGTSGYVLTAGSSAPQYVAQSTLSVGSATNATNTAITANSTNADYYITVVSANSGNLPQLVATGLTANPSTGKITSGISGGTF